MFSIKKTLALALIVSTLGVSGVAFAGPKSFHGSFSGPKRGGWVQPYNSGRHSHIHIPRNVNPMHRNRDHRPYGGGVRRQSHEFRRFGSRR